MNILLVGNGFPPLIPYGGLIALTTDLLAGLAERGHQLHYFCNGRFYPFARKPRLKRWCSGKITVWEVQNAPAGLGNAGRAQNDLQSPVIEQMFSSVLESVTPDVVHFHGPGGFPSSLIECALQRAFPTVLSFPDFSFLCPVHFLLDWEGKLCSDSQNGAKCALCFAHHPPPQQTPELTVKYELRRRLPSWGYALVRKAYQLWKERSNAADLASGGSVQDDTAVERHFFRKRWAVRSELLQKVHILHFQSRRCYEKMRQWFDTLPCCWIAAPSLTHLEKLPVRDFPEISYPIRFGTTAGFAGPYKGAQILCEAIRMIDQSEYADRYHLHVFGALHPDYREFVESHPRITYHGNYDREELPTVLQHFEVGLSLSLCEEGYGFAAVEMLAAGIPVISTPRGGAPEYIRPGLSGWLLPESPTAADVAEQMVYCMQHPEEIHQIHSALRRHSEQFRKPFSLFLEEMEALYLQAVHRVKHSVSTEHRSGAML